MNWQFSQLRGWCKDETGNVIGYGYAGRDTDDQQGKNNPSMEGVKGIGPLPHGLWKPVELFENHPTVGKFAVQVEPADQETLDRVVAYGRDPKSFFMHGDSNEHPGLASHGCMVEPRPVREKFWAVKPLIEVVQTA